MRWAALYRHPPILRGASASQIRADPFPTADQLPMSWLFGGVLERRVLNLLVEIAALVVADEMGADVLIAGPLRRHGFVLKATEESVRDALLKGHSRILRDHSFAHIRWKRLVSNTKYIETNSVV